MKNNSNTKYVHSTHARQTTKTAESFILYREAAAKNSKTNESSVTPTDKTTLFVEDFNALKQRIKTADRLNSYPTSLKCFWKEEVVRLGRKLGDVLKNVGC